MSVASRETLRDVDLRRYISGLGAHLGGAANVIMQLSWPAVGYGVMESRVESGSAMKHPVKRARTTFTYLAVALLGDEHDQQTFRAAVDRQHRQVRSDPNSPVRYNAMDPRLQMWVAACLYYGTADFFARMYGGMDDEVADALYAYSARFGTTLQVRPEMWPADREEFARYWEDALAEVHIDDTTRDYLMRLVRLENMPRVMQLLFAKNNLFWTTGFLPPLFREQMGLTWSDEQEADFNRRLRRLGRIALRLPDPIRMFPFNVLLMDMRRRHRAGKPLV